LVHMVEETRYWPRLGLRVTKKLALEAAERMSGQSSFYDDEVEEFVMTDNHANDAVSEVERLFDAPDESDEVADAKHTVILKSMQLHKQRRTKIKEFRKHINETFVFEDAEEYVQELVESGYTPEKANAEYKVEKKRRKDAEVNRLWDEWFDAEVIKLQKEYGTYKEPFQEDDEEDDVIDV